MGTSFLSLFFNIKKSVRSNHTPSPQRTVCTLVKMMIIMDDPLVDIRKADIVGSVLSEK